MDLFVIFLSFKTKMSFLNIKKPALPKEVPVQFLHMKLLEVLHTALEQFEILLAVDILSN